MELTRETRVGCQSWSLVSYPRQTTAAALYGRLSSPETNFWSMLRSARRFDTCEDGAAPSSLGHLGATEPQLHRLVRRRRHRTRFRWAVNRTGPFDRQILHAPERWIGVVYISASQLAGVSTIAHVCDVALNCVTIGSERRCRYMNACRRRRSVNGGLGASELDHTAAKLSHFFLYFLITAAHGESLGHHSRSPHPRRYVPQQIYQPRFRCQRRCGMHSESRGPSRQVSRSAY